MNADKKPRMRSKSLRYTVDLMEVHRNLKESESYDIVSYRAITLGRRIFSIVVTVLACIVFFSISFIALSVGVSIWIKVSILSAVLVFGIFASYFISKLFQ